MLPPTPRAPRTVWPLAPAKLRLANPVALVEAQPIQLVGTDWKEPTIGTLLKVIWYTVTGALPDAGKEIVTPGLVLAVMVWVAKLTVIEAELMVPVLPKLSVGVVPP